MTFCKILIFAAILATTRSLAVSLSDVILVLIGYRRSRPKACSSVGSKPVPDTSTCAQEFLTRRVHPRLSCLSF